MMRLGIILLSAVFTTVVSGEPILLPRAPCICPSHDLAFFPLGSSSTSTDLLRCFYPAIFRCAYSSVDGSLVGDHDSGFCPSSTIGDTCPPIDLRDYPLGPGSGIYDNYLFCAYPTVSQLSQQTYRCDYSLSSGLLVYDANEGVCPLVALGTCTALTTTVTITTAAPSTSSSFAPFPTTSSSGPATSSSKSHVAAIAVGSAIGSVVLVSVLVAALVLTLRRNSNNNDSNTAITSPMSATPLHRNNMMDNNLPSDRWQLNNSSPPSMLPSPYPPSPPPIIPTPVSSNPFVLSYPPNSLHSPSPSTHHSTTGQVWNAYPAPVHPNFPEI